MPVVVCCGGRYGAVAEASGSAGAVWCLDHDRFDRVADRADRDRPRHLNTSVEAANREPMPPGTDRRRRHSPDQ